MKTSKKELLQRWAREPGRSIIGRVNEFCLDVQRVGHGRSSGELLALLDGLPHRAEVAGGKDLRGAPLGGGVRDLDLRGWSFAYARLDLNFVECDLTDAIFDGVVAQGVILGRTLDGASFLGAKVRDGFFHQAVARRCTFDGAVLAGANFEEATLTGSSFRGADARRALFFGANLTGCDLRDARLDEAVFQSVTLDRTTDLRGASLINLHARETRDRHGHLVGRATDWRAATWDASTMYGADPAALPRQFVSAALAQLRGQHTRAAERMRTALRELEEHLANAHDPDWYARLIGALDESDRPWAEQVMNDAARSLL